MKLSHRAKNREQSSRNSQTKFAKKRLAAAAAIVVLFFILTSPTYHTGKPKVDVNGTSDYHEVYYGNRTAGVMESWIELHSPTDLYAYYYCGKRAGLQVGVFVLGYVGEEGIVTGNGTGNSSDGNAIGEEGTALGEGVTAKEEGGNVSNTSGPGSSAGSEGNTSLANSANTCIGIISPIPAVGELDPYGTGLRVCYGLRVVEGRSCAY